MSYSDASALSYGWPVQTTAEQLLDLACENAPVLKRIIAEFGDVTLLSYLKTLSGKTAAPYQDRGDLLETVYQYVAPLLGEDVARRTARDLEQHPVALTANHHGVDYFAQSVQGTLLLSLAKESGGPSPTTVPVFACGNIPMNNLTYPLGMLFYQVNKDLLEVGPKKLPVFPDRHKRTMVSAVGGFDSAMVERAGKRIETMRKNGEISPPLAACARDVLLSEYGRPEVMDLPGYSDQSVVLNHRLWKRMFADPGSAPDVVVLELEKLVARLLELDLRNPESLAWRVLFDRKLKRSVLEHLDGQRICWNRRNLNQRLRAARGEECEKVPSNGCGTLFFWGIDQAGRKIPLNLEKDPEGLERLCGVDDRGDVTTFPFTASGLVDGMRDGRLIPSLFTSYLVVSLARGVVCPGGYYQAEYLPAIQQRLVLCMDRFPEYGPMAEAVKGVTTDSYLSGMQTVMTPIQGGSLVPAGALEIMAGGGLTSADLEKIRAVTVREAHTASLSETVSDISERQPAMTDWKKQLAEDCDLLLRDRIVIK